MKMRRADLFLAFAHEHKIHRQLAPCRAERMQRCDQGRLRSLLVYGAAAHQHFPEPGLVDKRGLEWRRRPFGRICLLHVIHEI